MHSLSETIAGKTCNNHNNHSNHNNHNNHNSHSKCITITRACSAIASLTSGPSAKALTYSDDIANVWT